MLTASTQNTASLRRERRALCCSSSEPLGTNGFGLFIILCDGVLVRGNFIFEFGAAKLSLEKFRNALNLHS